MTIFVFSCCGYIAFLVRLPQNVYEIRQATDVPAKGRIVVVWAIRLIIMIAILLAGIRAVVEVRTWF